MSNNSISIVNKINTNLSRCAACTRNRFCAAKMTLGIGSLAASVFFFVQAAQYNSKYVVTEGLIAQIGEIDIGEVQLGQVSDIVFKVQNQSMKNRLEVVGVETDCGCTSSEVKATLLSPGEVLRLPIHLRAVGRGKFVRQVRVKHLINSKLHVLPLIIRGVSLPNFVVEPESVSFTKNRSGTAIVRLFSSNVDVVEFGRISVSHPSILARWADEQMAAGGRYMEVSFDHRLYDIVGSKSLEIRVTTSSAVEPIIVIHVHVNSRPDDETVPKKT